jgi:hypothetical protein
MSDREKHTVKSVRSRGLLAVVGLLGMPLVALGPAARADGNNDPAADNFTISFYRVSSPTVGELNSVRSTYRQAMADVEQLLAWTNSFDGSPIVDRVEVEWDELVAELEGGKIVKNRYKVKRTFRPRPKRGSPRGLSTPTQPPVPMNPATEIPGVQSQRGPTVTQPIAGPSTNPGTIGGLDPNFFDRIGSASGQGSSGSNGDGQTIRLRPPSSSGSYSGPRIRVFNGQTGQLIEQFNYDANGNRNSGRPVADGSSRSDQRRLVMDDSQPKNQSGPGRTTFTYDNNARKTSGDSSLQRRAELKRKGEEIEAEKASIQSERERLKREQSDLDRENQDLSRQSSQFDQSRQDVNRLQQQVDQTRRQIGQLQDQYDDYAGGGWKRGYNLCPDANSYDGCSAHPSAKQRWYRYAQGQMSRMRSRLTELKLWLPSAELQLNQQRDYVSDLQSRLGESRRRTDLDFRQHTTSVERLNARQSAWDQKASAYIQQVQALQADGP